MCGMLKLICLFLLQNVLGSLGIPWGLLGCFWNPSGIPLGPRATLGGSLWACLDAFRTPRGLVDQQLVDHQLVDQLLVDHLLVDQLLVDQQLVDQQLVDQQLVDQQLADQQLADQ